MKRFLILFVLFNFQTLLISQNPSEDFLGSWYTYGSNHRLTEFISFTPYAELRFYEPSSNYNLVFVSLRGDYILNSTSKVGIGYAFLDIDTVFEFDDKSNVEEQRLFEQFVHKHKWGNINITHRGRLEQRFLDFKTRHEMQNRFRYRIGIKYNFNKTLFMLVSEEPFVNFQDQVFHENRFYVGMGFNVTKQSQIQIGYLKQHIKKNNLNRIQIGLNFQVDHRKSKAALVQL